MTYVYKDEHTFVRRAVDKNPSQSGFAKREHCQLLLTCKTLYFTAKPMFYGLTEFFFSTTESFDKFFAMDTVAGAERCLWTRNVVCENVQLHPILYEKESMLGVDVEDVVVIREDMDEYYEADCEDNF